MQRLYGAVLILALVILAACGDSGDTIVSPAEVQNQIHVVGTATVKAAPDIAQTQLGVQTFSESLDEAMAENSTRAESVIAALKAGGVADRDIKTTSFHVYPQRDFRKEDSTGEIVGYWVNNTVAVTLRDLLRVGEMLQTAIDAGANSVNSLAFTLDDPDSLRQEARAQAVEDARQRAETLAAAAGVELGKPVRISEGSLGGPIYVRGTFDAAEAAPSSVPVEPGELEVAAQVEVVYEIR